MIGLELKAYNIVVIQDSIIIILRTIYLIVPIGKMANVVYGRI